MQDWPLGIFWVVSRCSPTQRFMERNAFSSLFPLSTSSPNPGRPLISGEPLYRLVSNSGAVSFI